MPFSQVIYNMLAHGMDPLFTIMVMVARLMGLGMFIVGLNRLHKHAGFQSVNRVSAKGTAFYLLSGAVLIAFMPELTALSSGLVGPAIPSELLNTCTASGPANAGNFLSGQYPCPMIAYANEIKSNTQWSQAQVMADFAYATLTLIGVYAFIKGFVLLVKLGDGQQQQGGMGQAVTHILAGVVGVNGPFFYSVLSSLLSGFGVN